MGSKFSLSADNQFFSKIYQIKLYSLSKKEKQCCIKKNSETIENFEIKEIDYWKNMKILVFLKKYVTNSSVGI